MSGKHSAGKGSTYRPVDRNKWNKNWEKAFGKKQQPKKKGRNKK